jgi:hypothetical protein
MDEILRLEEHTWTVPWTPEFIEPKDGPLGPNVARPFRHWCRDNLHHDYRFEWVPSRDWPEPDGTISVSENRWVLHLTSHEDWLLVTMKWETAKRRG